MNGKPKGRGLGFGVAVQTLRWALTHLRRISGFRSNAGKALPDKVEGVVHPRAGI